MTEGRSGPLSFSITDDVIERLFRVVPRITWEAIRDMVGGVFGSHRREWLAAKKVDFREKGGLRAGNLSSRDSVPGGFHGRRTFFYRVFPANKKAPAGRTPDLSEISGETFTRSEVAEGLEFGGTHRPKGGRFLPIPIGITLDSLGRPKSKWVTPSKYRRASPKNDLVTFRRQPGGPLVLHQRRRKGKVANNAPGAVSRVGAQGDARRDVFLPAYVLVPRVTRRARLKFYDTWDGMAADRDRRLSAAADEIVRQL